MENKKVNIYRNVFLVTVRKQQTDFKTKATCRISLNSRKYPSVTECYEEDKQTYKTFSKNKLQLTVLISYFFWKCQHKPTRDFPRFI
jgi:hypothetical protein